MLRTHTAAPPGGSTLADVTDVAATSWGRSGRRVAVGFLALVVVLGATGLLGVSSGQASDTRGGWTTTVTYPRIARSGLDVPLAVRVEHPGGFTGPVTVAVGNAYLDIFEQQDLRPDPDAVTAAPRFTYYTFTPPAGNALAVTFDVYVQPSRQAPAGGDVVVLIGGREVGRVHLSTWLAP